MSITSRYGLDEYMAARVRYSLAFTRRWHRLAASQPLGLCIDGNEYHRRQRARKRKRKT